MFHLISYVTKFHEVDHAIEKGNKDGIVNVLIHSKFNATVTVIKSKSSCSVNLNEDNKYLTY